MSNREVKRIVLVGLFGFLFGIITSAIGIPLIVSLFLGICAYAFFMNETEKAIDRIIDWLES